MRDFSAIVAMDEKGGIGKDGTLPWHLPPDLKHFKEITTKVDDPSKSNAVIMGRKTWDSLPEKFKPLPARLNVVVTRNKDLILPEEVLKAEGIESAISALSEGEYSNTIENVFVIGGGEIFKEALSSDHCQSVFLTKILADYQCDTFFPPLEDRFQEASAGALQQDNGTTFSFSQYLRK